MKSVLITGSNGLLGRNLSLKLAKQGFKVYGITHSEPAISVNGIAQLTIDFTLDWSDTKLPTQLDAIIHLAQSAKFRDFPDSAMDVFKVNVESTARLLDYAKRVGVERFIYTSSGGVYGNGTQAFKENEPINSVGQLGYYLGSKTCGEILVQSYASEFQVAVLRPFFIYGPGQNRSMLIPRLFDNISSCKPINVQGDNGIRINPIHVEDASNAVSAAMTLKESATFNIAGPEVLSIREICTEMGEFLDKQPIYNSTPGVANDIIADISTMTNTLYHPKRRLAEHLAEILPTYD